MSQCRVYVSKAVCVCVPVQDNRGDMGGNASAVYSWIVGDLMKDRGVRLHVDSAQRKILLWVLRNLYGHFSLLSINLWTERITGTYNKEINQ